MLLFFSYHAIILLDDQKLSTLNNIVGKKIFLKYDNICNNFVGKR